MNTFDRYLLKKENLIKRRVEIDASLYEKLAKIADKKYDASINKLVNIAIIEMIKTNNIQIYQRPQNEISESHNFAIRESSYKEMEKLRDKYGLSIHKLINIAIYNALNSEN